MTRKKPTLESAPTGHSKQPTGKISLFMETTAQILRLAGSIEMQRGINELVDGAGKIGTSWFVKQEFDRVYVRLYGSIAKVASRLTHPEDPRNFDDLWETVLFNLPMYYPGGSRLLPHLTKCLYRKFFGKSISPMFLSNLFGGLKEDLRLNFLEGDFFDKSSCGVWKSRGSCDCTPEPGEHCRLKDICVAQRDDFLARATTIAGTDASEGKWFRKNLPALRASKRKSMLEFIGKHPNPVGDLIIFCEVPDGWTILTRDRIFPVLQKAHRKKVNVLIVRLPRLGIPCTVQTSQGGTSIPGVLIDYNEKGARVRVPGVVLKKKDVVIVSAVLELGNPREGDVVYVDEKNDSVFAVKFPEKVQ